MVGTRGNYAGLEATVSFVSVGMEISLEVEDSPSNAGLGAVREMWKIAFCIQIEKGIASGLQLGEESFHPGRLVVTLSNTVIIFPSCEYTRPVITLRGIRRGPKWGHASWYKIRVPPSVTPPLSPPIIPYLDNATPQRIAPLIIALFQFLLLCFGQDDVDESPYEISQSVVESIPELV